MPGQPLSPVALFELVLVLLALVVPLELTARRLRLPPAAALILGGMAVALLPLPFAFSLDPDLMLVLFLPPLLMSSAFFTVWRDFRANVGRIGGLAVGAVVFTTACVGVVAHWAVPGLPWAACFTLGAIVSPPDALAAKAVLEHVALPHRLMVVLEGESLVNDASGLVLFRLAVAAALSGGFSAGDAVLSFVALSAGGIVVGLACCWLAVRLLARLREPSLTAVGSLLTAWASYIVADRLGVSGVLSTVACGLMMGSKQHEVMSASGRQGAGAIWDAVRFVLESLVFVLIGLSLRTVLADGSASVWPLLPAIGVVLAAVILSRFAWVFATVYIPGLVLRRGAARPALAGVAVLGWAGMRGVVSLAIALSLPQALPGRGFILITTFAVILVTVVVQGTTLAPLIRLLRLAPAQPGAVPGPGIAPGPEAAPGMDEIDARARLALVQLAAMRRLAVDGHGVLQHPRLLEQYEYRSTLINRVRQAETLTPGLRARHFDIVLELVRVARHELLQLYRSGAVHDSVMRVLETELDLEELMARKRRGPDA